MMHKVLSRLLLEFVDRLSLKVDINKPKTL